MIKIDVLGLVSGGTTLNTPQTSVNTEVCGFLFAVMFTMKMYRKIVFYCS